jgi:hypothetical protein
MFAHWSQQSAFASGPRLIPEPVHSYTLPSDVEHIPLKARLH